MVPFDNDSDGTSSPDDANSGSGNQPLFTNDDEGAAAWLHTDKNGNAYLSIKLPLGLGSLNLFPATDAVENALNRLHEHLADQ